jgi:hypothetical protein
MDSRRFDALAKTFPSGVRRQAVRFLAVIPVAGLLASLVGAREPVQAGKKKCCRRGQQGPAGPAGTFGTIIMREASAGAIAAGATAGVFPTCEAGETPVSVGFACGDQRAYATVMTTNTSGAQINFFNSGTSTTVCTGNVLCAS